MSMLVTAELTDEEVIEKVRNTDKDLYILIIERYQKKLAYSKMKIRLWM